VARKAEKADPREIGGVVMKRMICAALTIAALCAAFVGCANRGVKVTCSSASTTSLADINWEEYKWPVFSIYTGPRLVVWINKDFAYLSRINGSGCVTNDTACLGIYADKQGKTANVELEFKPVSTNLITTATTVAE